MVLELIIDFLPWPRGRKVGNVTVEMGDSGSILPSRPGGITSALDERGWVDGKVVAAGDLRQGKRPSLPALVTGAALLEVLRPRRSRRLPRHFVLAVTAERVVAFKAVGGTDGEYADGPYRLWIRPGARGSWPRSAVRLVVENRSSGAATLVLDVERIPVYRPNPDADPSTDELVRLLGC
ncbi:MAG TPA: hypothetical protein VD704_06730 [Gaiellaceae bacterium]|nr:hypothetical protein [Gaiellaceae bacterium]